MSIIRKIKLAANNLLEVRCPYHPFYKGIRAPKVDCLACELIHANPEKTADAKR